MALARALIHQPRWLLADEPTGSLDEHNAEQVMALMMSAVRDTGAGLLLVSHNPGYGDLADRVLRLEGDSWSSSRAPPWLTSAGGLLMLPLKALLRLYRAHPWLLLMSLTGLTLGSLWWWPSSS